MQQTNERTTDRLHIFWFWPLLYQIFPDSGRRRRHRLRMNARCDQSPARPVPPTVNLGKFFIRLPLIASDRRPRDIMTSWLDVMRAGTALPLSNSIAGYLELPSDDLQLSSSFRTGTARRPLLRTLTQRPRTPPPLPPATFFLICPRIMPSFGVRTLVLRPYGNRIPVCAHGRYL